MGIGNRRSSPAPPTPSTPTTRIMGISIWCQSAYDIPSAATVRLDDPDGTTIASNKVSDTRFLFTLPADRAMPGHGATLTVVLLNARDAATLPARVYTTRIILQPSLDVDVPAPTLPLPAALHADGQWFRSGDGTHVFVAGISGFALHQVFTESMQRADDFLGHVKELGYDEVRVFTRYRGGLGDFSGHLDSLPVLCEHAGTFGMRLELVASADHKAFGWTDDAEVLWHKEVCNIAAGFPHISVEGVNEGTHPANAFAYGRLYQPTGVLAARGSGQSDEGTLAPLFTGSLAYATYHPARSNDFPRKVGHNAWEDVAARFNIATKANEIARPDETGFDADSYFDAGANAALFITAATMHDTEGKLAHVATNRAMDCRRAFVRGARAIDLGIARNGRYTAGHLSDCPLIVNGLPSTSRVHAKVFGNRAQAVITQMPATCTPIGVDGWHITGINGSVIALERLR